MGVDRVAVLMCRGKTYQLPCLLDPQDYERAVSRGNWFVTHAARSNGKRYAVRSEGGVLVFLHKEVLRWAGVEPASALHVIGDHENGDSMDNRRGNLRWATHAENAKNRFGIAHIQQELPLWPTP